MPLSTEHLAAAVRVDERVSLHADLHFPPDPVVGVVVFAQVSARHAPRTAAIAAVLHEHHLATFTLDLLTHEEDQVDSVTLDHRSDMALLGARLAAAVDHLAADPHTRELPVGILATSTAAGAALALAAERPGQIRAVVSRSGRPDLAGEALGIVRCPTLLLVAGEDSRTMEFNERALPQLKCIKDLLVIPTATHYFAEPAALTQLSHLAAKWFEHHLR